MKHKPTIAIAMGDPAGIGPELIVKVLSDATVFERCHPFIIGDLLTMRNTAASLGSSLRFRAINDLSEARFQPEVPDLLNPPGFELGPLPPPAVHSKLGEAAARYLALAYELASESRVDGVVMAPMNKESFRAAGYDYVDELAIPGLSSPAAMSPILLGAVRTRSGRSPSPSISPSSRHRRLASSVDRVLSLYKAIFTPPCCKLGFRRAAHRRALP